MTDVANGNHQEMARTRAPGRATSKHPRADSDNEPNANEIKLRSIEGNLYVVPAEAACLSMKVKRMVDEHKYQPFSLCISSNDLEKVIEFWKLTQNDSSPAAHAEFISQFDDETLFNTMVTARDLEVKSLLELTKHAVVRGLKAKTEEELHAWLQHLFIDDADSAEAVE